MPSIRNLFQIGATATLAAALIVAHALAPTGTPLAAPSASAATPGVTCGAISCSVSTTIESSGSWNDAEHEGGGSTSGGSTSPYVFKYQSCVSYVPVGGGTSTGSYPVQNSSSYRCWFDDGRYSAGQGSDGTSCPPMSDRAAKGKFMRYYKNPSTGVLEFTEQWTCAWPTDDYAPVWKYAGSGDIYTRASIEFFITNSNANAAKTFGGSGRVIDSATKDRSVDFRNPEAYTKPWTYSYNPKTETKNKVPSYGYHRLETTMTYRTVTKYAMPAWLNVTPKYEFSGDKYNKTANPYTYACNIGSPALQAGIVTGAQFDPSDCQQAHWQCAVSGDIAIYTKSKDEMTSEQARADSEAMRNNEPLEVIFPTAKATGSSNVVSNIGDYKTLTEVDTSKVSPVSTDTADANSGIQWFDSKGTKFNTWVTAKDTSDISFLWASDEGKSWYFTQKYQFTAKFLVPTTLTVGGATTYKWVVDTAECGVTKTSPKVTVIRSINN